MSPGKGQEKEMGAQLMRKIKKVMNLLQVNWRTMAEFEILYKVLSLIIFTPLFLWAFNGIMKVTGYQYLTIENVFPFFSESPDSSGASSAGCLYGCLFYG